MGGGAWPPASPYTWQDSWYDSTGGQRSIVISIRFDSPVNGGGTNALQGVDYDLDPACPWSWLVVGRSNGTLITQQIPRASRTGTLSANQLSKVGLKSFNDIGSITVSATQT